jgi:hypothetical protein
MVELQYLGGAFQKRYCAAVNYETGSIKFYFNTWPVVEGHAPESRCYGTEVVLSMFTAPYARRRLGINLTENYWKDDGRSGKQYSLDGTSS